MTETDSPPVMLFNHCVRAYQFLRSKSDIIKDDNRNERVVWTGFMTHVIRDELSLSVPYYTKILKALEAMGCVEQLRRGGSSTPSQWELLHEPTLELFEGPKMVQTKKLTRMDEIEDRVIRLSSRVDRLYDLLAKGVELDG